jgi:hypothetical protein
MWMFRKPPYSVRPVWKLDYKADFRESHPLVRPQQPQEACQNTMIPIPYHIFNRAVATTLLNGAAISMTLLLPQHIEQR